MLTAFLEWVRYLILSLFNSTTIKPLILTTNPVVEELVDVENKHGVTTCVEQTFQRLADGRLSSSELSDDKFHPIYFKEFQTRHRDITKLFEVLNQVEKYFREQVKYPRNDYYIDDYVAVKGIFNPEPVTLCNYLVVDGTMLTIANCYSLTYQHLNRIHDLVLELHTHEVFEEYKYEYIDRSLTAVMTDVEELCDFIKTHGLRHDTEKAKHDAQSIGSL